jgi:hypothetical protein
MCHLRTYRYSAAKFLGCFETTFDDWGWVCNTVGLLGTSFPLTAPQELTDLKEDRIRQLKFRDFLLDIYWLSVEEERDVISTTDFGSCYHF